MEGEERGEMERGGGGEMERWREVESDRKKERERERESVCVCVCVWSGEPAPRNHAHTNAGWKTCLLMVMFSLFLSSPIFMPSFRPMFFRKKVMRVRKLFASSAVQEPTRVSPLPVRYACSLCVRVRVCVCVFVASIPLFLLVV